MASSRIGAFSPTGPSPPVGGRTFGVAVAPRGVADGPGDCVSLAVGVAVGVGTAIGVSVGAEVEGAGVPVGGIVTGGVVVGVGVAVAVGVAVTGGVAIGVSVSPSTVGVGEGVGPQRDAQVIFFERKCVEAGIAKLDTAVRAVGNNVDCIEIITTLQQGRNLFDAISVAIQ